MKPIKVKRILLSLVVGATTIPDIAYASKIASKRTHDPITVRPPKPGPSGHSRHPVFENNQPVLWSPVYRPPILQNKNCAFAVNC